MKWLESERKKLNRLSSKQKLGYIWDYYKLWIIGCTALVLFAWYLVGNYISSNREINLYVAFVNTLEDIGEGSAFWDGYVTAARTDPEQETVIFDTENYFNMEKSNVTGNHYYEKAVVLLDSGTMDAIVMEKKNLAALGSGGRLIDLTDARTQALMEKYADRIITAEYTGEAGVTREVPVGIDISDSILVTRVQAYSSCALGISANAKHIDAVEAFLDYVLEE